MPTANNPAKIIPGSFNLPFAEQIEFFRQKVNLPTAKWDDIRHADHDRSFVVAGAMKADILADLLTAVDKSIAKGTGLEAFRKDFWKTVNEKGWHGWTGEGTKSGEAWRTKVIWETNLRTSYMAGRHAQLTDPDLLKIAPYWRYIHSESVLHPRPEHLAWDGLTLPHDHPFWQTHFPPNGWGCQCRVVAETKPKDGDKTAPPEGWNKISDKTGNPPGIDKGWAYAPGKSVAEELREIVKEKAAKLPDGIAQWFIADTLKSQAFADWFANPGKGTAWPVARIPDADATAMGAKEGVRVAVLSDETLLKQKRPDKHPEISPAEYAKAQEVIDRPTYKLQEGARNIVYVQVEPTTTEGGYVTVVKATVSGDELFMTSFRRLSRGEAERDAAIKRLLNRGKQ
ncbi:MAG: phage head morphogenesis protein [Zoogloeaceae bacterium]|jgi:hypothetical protein|nr:phage head morphogenesis protein [Zoogloeaceae bacterium]